MNPESLQADRQLFTAWLLASFAGWLLGLGLVLAGALLGDLLGSGGARFILGVGMGTGVGYMQGRIVKQLYDEAGPWLWASFVGIGAPFFITDLLAAAWTSLPYALPLSVATGGLLTGYLQRRILAPHTPAANWWVAASFAGWSLAAGMAAVSGMLTGVLPGAWGTIFNLGLILLGGVVLGAVTGGALVWILRR